MTELNERPSVPLSTPAFLPPLLTSHVSTATYVHFSHLALCGLDESVIRTLQSVASLRRECDAS